MKEKIKTDPSGHYVKIGDKWVTHQKRKPGRPPGSKNKRPHIPVLADAELITLREIIAIYENEKAQYRAAIESGSGLLQLSQPDSGV